MQSWQYIALLGAVIVVTAAILPKSKSKQTSEGSTHKQIEQMELSFEQFMANMEKEHDDLVKMLSSSLQTMREEDLLKSDQIARLEKRCAELEQQLSSLSHESVALGTKVSLLSTNTAATDAGIMPLSNEQQEALTNEPAPIDENSIHNRYAELFEMYEQGKSIESIAKKLGKNKGEVQLILQLAKQEENARHA